MKSKQKNLFFLLLLVVYTYFVYGPDMQHVPFVYVQKFLIEVPLRFLPYVPLGNSMIREDIRCVILISLVAACALSWMKTERGKYTIIYIAPLLLMVFMISLHIVRIYIGVDDPFRGLLTIITGIAIRYLIFVACVGTAFLFFLIRKKRREGVQRPAP